MKNSPNSFCWWFRFNPHEFLKYTTVSDEEAGKRFKSLLISLLTNEAPEGTPEFSMIQNALDYKARQREKANKRWGNEDGGNPPQVPPQTLSMPQQPLHQRRLKPPSLSDVYDFCDAERISPTTGREWYEWQCNKGWNSIKTQWQVALRAFAKKMKMEINHGNERP